MSIKSLNHMGIVSSDLDQTRRFYLDFLGMMEVSRPSNFVFEGAWFNANNQDQIHVIMSKDTSSDPGMPDPGVAKTGGMSTHIAFEVDDLETYVARARAMKIEIVGGPFNRGLGARQIYLEDPDGYQIELFERTNQMESDQVRGALLE
ncbi:MAG: VOC family protein [Chloroflexota bacterium]